MLGSFKFKKLLDTVDGEFLTGFIFVFLILTSFNLTPTVSVFCKVLIIILEEVACLKI